MKRPRNPIDVKIGTNIRHLRCSKGMTSEAVGKAFEEPLTYQQICKYERGESSLTSRGMVELSKILECDVTCFFEGVADLLATSRHVTTSLANGKLMQDITALPPAVQNSVRELVAACAINLAGKLGATR